jgi:hypothetical protein
METAQKKEKKTSFSSKQILLNTKQNFVKIIQNWGDAPTDTNADLPTATTNWSTSPPPKPSKKETATAFGKMGFAPMARDASFATTK